MGTGVSEGTHFLSAPPTHSRNLLREGPASSYLLSALRKRPPRTEGCGDASVFALLDFHTPWNVSTGSSVFMGTLSVKKGPWTPSPPKDTSAGTEVLPQGGVKQCSRWHSRRVSCDGDGDALASRLGAAGPWPHAVKSRFGESA